METNEKAVRNQTFSVVYLTASTFNIPKTNINIGRAKII
jgi:hypothetical protein